MFYLKKKRFGYQTYEGEPDDDTLYVISKKEYNNYEKAVEGFQEDIESLSDEVEKLNAEAKRDRSIRHSLYEENDGLKKQIEEINTDRDKYFGRSEYFSKILRERSNAARNITPKKKHTGYVYVFTQPFIYRYEKEGRIYSESLLKTKFQTPYKIDMDFKYIKEQCLDDFTFNKIDKQGYGNLLGLQTGIYLEKFEDIEKYIRKKISEQCKGDLSKSKEITKAINDMNIICNPQLIRNGLSGYWEFLFFHKRHLDSIPEAMSVKRKKKKTEAAASDSDEDAIKENISNVEISVVEEEAEG